MKMIENPKIPAEKQGNSARESKFSSINLAY